MSPRQPKLQKLTISLAKEGSPREGVLHNPDTLAGFHVPSVDPDRQALYIVAKPPTPPAWTKYLRDHVEGSIDGLVTASASAVLLVEAAGRLFALTFGHGRHLLATEAFEEDFGLKVVLNTVAPDQLKSVDAKTIDETTVHTRRDVSRDSPLSAFDLDISRDLLRAVTGTPRDETLAHRLTGADALGIHTRAQVPEIPALAQRLLEAYQLEVYKTHFDFIDYLRPEKSAQRINDLEELLLQALSTREITDVHLAPPETLDWIDVDGFTLSTLSGEDQTDTDPRISTYLDSREDAELDIALLKHDRLIAKRVTDGEPLNSWPIYRSIVYQVELDGCLYVFSAGQWFRVDLDYRDRVESDVNRLKRLEGLPAADAGTSEDAYNVKAAATIDALCLDKKLVYDGGPDKMEICDLLTRAGGLIHVKHRGSSSTLSHLFSQGINSAERLLLDADFRQKARAVVSKEDASFADVLPTGRPQPTDHEISFVVITRSNRSTPFTLPFFSLVSLRAAARTLDGFGFTVSVAAVPEAPE